MSDIACVSCKKSSDPIYMKVFMEIVVCPGCHAAATAALMKLDREINQLKFVAREAIRMGVIEGKFIEGTKPEPAVSQKNVLETVLELKKYAGRGGKDDDSTHRSDG